MNEAVRRFRFFFLFLFENTMTHSNACVKMGVQVTGWRGMRNGPPELASRFISG
jgi:hypothetical protein